VERCCTTAQPRLCLLTSAGLLTPTLVACQLQGIIHRDIKPENILLMTDKSIKLADFGLSIDATSERPVTRAGTLDYMAPEVPTHLICTCHLPLFLPVQHLCCDCLV